MVRSLSRFFVILCLLFPALPGKLAATEVIFNRISVNDGLSSNFVNCVWQSSDGFIWVGTDNGLQRYDGKKFIQIYRDDQYRLPSLPVSQIVGRRNEQVMWIRMGQIIGQYDLKTFRFKAAKIAPQPVSLTRNQFRLQVDSKGHIFLVVHGYDILVYQAATNTFVHDKKVLDVPRGWNPNTFSEEQATGNIWVGGDAGLGLFDASTKQFYHAGNNPKRIPVLDEQAASGFVRHVNVDPGNKLWMITWPPAGLGIYSYDFHSLLFRKHVYEQIPKSTYFEASYVFKSNGITWLYGLNVFNLFEQESQVFSMFYDPMNTNFGIRFTTVNQLFEDADHNIWVATDNGLYLTSVLKKGIRHGTIYQFKQRDITSVRAISGNRILSTSWGSKVNILKSDQNLVISEDSGLINKIYRGQPSNDDSYAFAWDSREHSQTGHLWITCQAGRLMRYDPLKGKSEFMRPPVFGGSTVRQVVEDHRHRLWFATQSGRLIRREDDGSFRVMQNLHTAIFKLYIDRQGRLWAGTGGNGLFLVDTGSGKIVHRYTAGKDTTRNLTMDNVADITQLSDTTFAVACFANLDILNVKTHRIKQLSSYNGLPQRMITSLQTDARGQLWMSTIGGICRYDPQNGTFRMYDQKDGLITTTNNENLLNVSTRLGSGELLFAGANKFIIFDAEHMRDLRPPKDVSITDILLFTDHLPVDSIQRAGGLNLPHQQNSLTIQFASLSYTQGNKLNYFYQLEGAGDQWMKAENSTSASFASLAHGKYVFRVKCVNSEGLWSPHVTSLSIVIRPAFWQTWWFLVLLVLTAALPFYLIYRLKINRLKEVHKLREKVARDLHDDMGSTLTSINILSEMAGFKLKGENDTVKDYLGRISSNSSEMMDAMDDIVWTIKPSNDTLSKLSARMREYAATVLEPQNITYTFTSNEKSRDIKLDMDARRSLFLIFKESLNNISKYASAGNVSIDFRAGQSLLSLVITDDGKGFDTSELPAGNGLANMKKRTGMLGGKFSLYSEPGKGTRISIEIQIT